MRPTLWLVGLLPLVAGIFEDQAGKLDWRRENIGEIDLAIYQGSKRSMLVASTSNVIASTNVRSGKIEWRHVLREKIDKIFHQQKMFVVVSGRGQNVRVFHPNDGALLWESIGAPDSSAGNAGDAVAADEHGIAVIRGNSVYMLSYTTGETLWTWSAKAGVTLKQLQWRHGFCSVIGDTGSALFVGALDAKGHVVGDAKELAGSWDQSVVVTTPLDEGNVLSYGSVIVTLLEDGKTLSLWDLQTHQKAEISTATLVGGGAVSSLAALAPSKHRTGVPAVVLKTDSGAQVVVYVDVKGAAPTAKKVREFTEANRVFGAIASPPTWPTENQQQMITTAVIGEKGTLLEVFNAVDGEEVKSGTASVPTVTLDSHGHGVALFPQLFSKRDGSIGTRVLLTAQDHAAVMVQPGREDKDNKAKGPVLWIREEALASVTQSAFVDYESASVKTTKMGIPSLATRVQMQVGDMVSLVNSLPQLVESFTKKEPIATGDAEARTQDFGLDKLILLMTAPGKLFALHTSSGRVVWSRLFKGCDKMVVTRTKPTQSNKFPEVLLPASELSADGTRKMLWVNGASGAEIEAGSFPAGVVKYMSLEADRNFNKPAEDSVGAHGMSFALVDGANQVRLFPDTEASHTSFRARATDYYYNHLMEEGGSQVLRGYTVANPKGGQGTSAAGSAYDTIPQWTVVFPKTERVIETAGHDKTEIIDSPVHIAGDDSLLLKYLNPHVIAVATVKRDAADNAVAVHGQVKSVDNAKLLIYLIDTITGRIIHRISNQHGSAPVNIVKTENWVIYSYWNQKHKRTELGSIALFEMAIEKYGLNPYTRPEIAEEFSSYAASSPVVFHKTFIAPTTIKTMAVTDTIRGITSRHLLIASASNQLYSLNRRFIDPRRPHGPPTPIQQMEGLMQYHAHLPLIPTSVVSYNISIANVHSICASPSALESTSLVLAYGLDLFYVRVAPAKSFDLLAADFDHALLILLISGLFLATVVVSQLVKRKVLMQRWK